MGTTEKTTCLCFVDRQNLCVVEKADETNSPSVDRQRERVRTVQRPLVAAFH